MTVDAFGGERLAHMCAGESSSIPSTVTVVDRNGSITMSSPYILSEAWAASVSSGGGGGGG